MLTAIDKNTGKTCCAVCHVPLKKEELVKDRFLPRSCSNGVSTHINYIGVCKDCHKQRLKTKIVFPEYYRHLSSEQKSNLKRCMKNNRSNLIYEASDDDTMARLNKL